MRGKLLEIAKTIYVDIISRDIFPWPPPLFHSPFSHSLALAMRMINYRSELCIFEYEKR